MRQLLEAEEFDLAAQVIADRGQEWITSGALGSLVASSDALPVEAMERHPRALTCRAEVSRLRGEFDKARAMFRRATVLLQGQGDGEGEAEALQALATIARRHGDFTAAFAYLDRATELSGRAIPGAGEIAAIRAGHAWWRWANGLKRSANTAPHCNWPRSSVTSITRAGLFITSQGRRRCAGILARRCAGYASRFVTSAIPRPCRRRRTFITMWRDSHLYSAANLRFASSIWIARMERCQLFDMIGVRAQVFEAYRTVCIANSATRRGQGRFTSAPRAIMTGPALNCPDMNCLMNRRCSLKIGNLAAARKLIDRLINAPANFDDELRIQTAALTLGRTLIAQGEEESASAGLDSALGYFRRNGLYYYEAQDCIALAQCDFASGRDVQMMEQVRRALDLAARYDYEYWLRGIAAHRN